MSILCCRRRSLAPVHEQKIQIQPPKILRRLSFISISNSQATPQTTETFYNEGRELSQARQEGIERPSLYTSYGADMREHLGRGDAKGDAAVSRDLSSPTARSTGDELFDNGGSQTLIVSYNSTEFHRTRLPFKSTSAIELRPKTLVTPSFGNSPRKLGSGKSMPTLASLQSPKAVQKLPQLMLSDLEICSGLLASQERSHIDIPPSGLSVVTAASKTPTTPKFIPITMPPTPSLSPYLMPSIATTIVSINEGQRVAHLGVGDRYVANKDSGDEGMDIGALEKQQNRIGDTDRAGVSLETERELATATNLLEKERDPSNDIMDSDERFRPGEFFSKIPGWVKPSTSTFMSFPSSSPDPNQSKGPVLPFSTGNTALGRMDSTSSESHSPPETAGTGSARTSSPLTLHPSTPRYHFRQSTDNASSFYPSHETSRCQSLVGSIEASPGLLHMPMWSVSTVARTSNRTPRPLDGVNISAPPENPAFRFPWINRSASESPDPIANQDAFTRGSSLAHLKQSQKRGQDLQRVPRVKPRDTLHRLQPGDPLTQKYSEGYENIHLQQFRTMPGRPDYVQSTRTNWLTDNRNQEHLKKKTTVFPASTTNNSIDHSVWEGFPARVGSLPVPNEMARDTKNWRSSHGWKPRNPKGNTFSSYSKNGQKFSLRNSISLGERMWGHGGIPGENQKEHRGTTKINVWTGPMLDAESRDESEETNSQRFNKRAMIRPRSMTLRRTFTSSIAKLRGKVSFSGSSKVTVVSLSPMGKSGNKEPFYQMRNEGQRPINRGPEVLNELEVSESEMSSAVFEPTLPGEILELENSRESSNDTSPGNRDITQCSSPKLQLDSPLSLATTSVGRSAFSTASEGPRSTIYDDCVVFPFTSEDEAKDENENGVPADSGLETPMSRSSDVCEKRVRQVWRDTKESFEVTN